MTYKINPQDEIEVYENGQMVGSYYGVDVKKESPEWNWEINVGDIIAVSNINQQKRIVEIETRFPDGEDTVMRYKLYLE